MRRLAVAFVLVVAVAGAAAHTARADEDSATHYYVSLGDSLAAGTNASGVGVAFTNLGYADQLHAALSADDPKLDLVKLGCPGESTVSMRFGSQLPSVVGSCGPPRYYKNFLYSKGTQLAESVSFLEAHKGKVALVTINLGANDLNHRDAQGNLVACLFPPEDCDAESASIAHNLAAILFDVRTAAGPDVPIVGMTYYNVFLPLGDPVVNARINALNNLLASTFAAAGVSVADVAGAFSTAERVCAWTWFCTNFDTHPNATGYGVIADAFLDVIQAVIGRKGDPP
jgi:lysophospholipase L1-like esterase